MRAKSITAHAISRFRERTGCKKDDVYVANKLFEILDKAEETDFKDPKFKVLALINHNFKEASYYKFQPKRGAALILVVEDQELKTIHNNESSRWK